MSHKCGFTGGQEGWCDKNSGGQGGRDHRKKESHRVLKTPPPPPITQCAGGKKRKLEGAKDVELLGVLLLLFDGV